MRQVVDSRKRAWNLKERRPAAADLMEFFYPLHYEIGTALEDVVRSIFYRASRRLAFG
jgi:hypothetical protein